MANPDSLRPFQKGHDPRRNLKGRISKPLNETSALKKYLLDSLHRKVTVNGRKRTFGEIIAERIVDDAGRAGYLHYRECRNRLAGIIAEE